jgi:hypothetical protein
VFSVFVMRSLRLHRSIYPCCASSTSVAFARRARAAGDVGGIEIDLTVLRGGCYLTSCTSRAFLPRTTLPTNTISCSATIFRGMSVHSSIILHRYGRVHELQAVLALFPVRLLWLLMVERDAEDVSES